MELEQEESGGISIDRKPDETDDLWAVRLGNRFFRNMMRHDLWTVLYQGKPVHDAVDVRYAIVDEKEVVYVTLSSGECVEYPRDGFCVTAMTIPKIPEE